VREREREREGPGVGASDGGQRGGHHWQGHHLQRYGCFAFLPNAIPVPIVAERGGACGRDSHACGLDLIRSQCVP
jgi:hypothetical protein